MTARERLLLFGRLPEPGRTKTRLEPALGKEGAARLYQAFLDDLTASHRWVHERELWIPDRPDAKRLLSARYPGCRVRIKAVGDLGVRVSSAFEAAFSESVDYAVALGSDHPTLPAGYVRTAFEALREVPLVFGPVEDGGYYVIGLGRSGWPRARGLFEGSPWSRPELLGWSRARARDLDLGHVELPTWYDVDRPSDLSRLKADVAPGSTTAEVLSELGCQQLPGLSPKAEIETG